MTEIAIDSPYLGAKHAPEAGHDQNETEKDRVVNDIIATEKAFYNKGTDINGDKFRYGDVVGKNLELLPITPGSVTSAEERQHTALAELDLFKQIIEDPKLKAAVASGRYKVEMHDYSWTRSEAGDNQHQVPVYTVYAFLNPNLALSLSFDLDDAGYTTKSQSHVLMSKDAEYLYHCIAPAGKSETSLAA